MIASISKRCLLGALALTLGGCGSGVESGSGDEVPPPPPTITSFSIDPTYLSPPIIGVPVIDADYKNGAFGIDWQIAESEIDYEGDVYFTVTPLANASDDIKLFSLNCGPVGLGCSAIAHVDCRLTENKHVACDGDTDVDISIWLTAVPKDAYLILAARRGHASASFSTVSVQIR